MFPEGHLRLCAHLEAISQNATGHSLTFSVPPSYAALSFSPLLFSAPLPSLWVSPSQAELGISE